MSSINRAQQRERITHYEILMEEAEALLYSGGCDAKMLERLRILTDELAAYYASDSWKSDFADDEAGLLPRDLRRGVLSEDGIYHLLEAYAELIQEGEPDEADLLKLE